MRIPFALISVAVVFSYASNAQAREDQGDHHDQPNSEIVVTAVYARSQNDLLFGTSVLNETELTRELRPTIGETLTRQAGVSSTSFGPNASRPVLRGFQGERVRVLTDGIGSFDVSNTSVDHAVAINPLTASRIEVLRGPAALLFGSSAIGGVVNVIDTRIPRRRMNETIHFDGLATYGTAANERSTSGAVDVPLGNSFVAHFDGSYSKTGDLRVGGSVLTPPLRAAAIATGVSEIADLASLRGKLPNSAGRTWSIAGGGAYIGSTGNLGFSIARYDNLYGIPVRFSLDPAVQAEEVKLHARQTRYDFRGEFETGSGLIETIKFRGGYADYVHDELADTGKINSTFKNQGWEGRLELVQRDQEHWKGAFGAQMINRKLNIVGDEKFLPLSRSEQFGLFTLQSVDLGAVRTEFGGRFEHSRLTADADSGLGTPAASRKFNTISASAGASLEVAPEWRVGLNLSHTERAPSAEELFSNGPHAGTQAFEVGDPNFKKERSAGIEGTLRGKGDGFSLSASAYYSAFKNFIFETPSGALEDNLPVFKFQQATASYYGAEMDATFRIVQIGGMTVNLDSIADFTRARAKGGTNLPRIPALRYLTGIEAQSKSLDLRAEAEWVGKQKQISNFETPTSGYTMVNASLAWRPLPESRRLSVMLSANNLFDVNARRHASFLKDYAPLAGRDIRLSVRVTI